MAGIQPSMKKRQIIANSSRTMFLWVAGMSGVVGVCVVLCIFLFQQLMFKTEVGNRLEKTASTLQSNNKKTSALMDNLRVRSTDAGLSAVKARPDDQPLQAVLDALPADKNALALGSSLQQKLLTGVNGVVIESMAVDAPNSIASQTATTTASSSALKDVEQMPITFVATSNNPNNLKDFLAQLERSLRVIDIDSLRLETSASKYTMTVTAHAYYKPGKIVQLGSEVVKPK